MKKLLFVPLLAIFGIFSAHTALLVSMLFFMTFIDFITGVVASYIEDKKVKKEYKAYFIQSEKLRTSVLKTLSYMTLILVSHFFALIFGIGVVTIPIVGLTATLATLAFTMCISIETYSVFENLKRSGFDIFAKFKSVVNAVIKIIKYIVKTKNNISKEL